MEAFNIADELLLNEAMDLYLAKELRRQEEVKLMLYMAVDLIFFLLNNLIFSFLIIVI